MKLIGIEGCWRYPRNGVVWCCWMDGRFQLRSRIEVGVQYGTYQISQRPPERYLRILRLQSPPKTGCYIQVDFDGRLHREVWFLEELSRSHMTIRYFEMNFVEGELVLKAVVCVLDDVKF